MPDRDAPLDGKEIKAFITEVADALPDTGPRHTVIVVGGALLAWSDLRDSTRDVDSVLRLEDELCQAVALVGSRHGLQPRWLNDAAAAFRPSTFREQDCVTLLDHTRLHVLGAPMDQVFLMKLYRVDAQDFEDMIQIWPLCGFTSADEVAELFFEAYPHAPEDPHLSKLIRTIAERAEAEI